METLVNEPFVSFLFVGLGLVFLLLEVFVPSGGILGFLSVGCTVFGIYGLFHQDRIALAFAAITGSAVVTFLGIRFGLRRLSFSGSLAVETATARGAEGEALLGKEGVTACVLRPAGIAIIDGRKVDVVTRGAYIDANVRVRVIERSGNRIVVEELPVDPG